MTFTDYKRPKRRGIATVELALTLPVLLTIVLGTIEVCQMMFVRQSAIIVAYEGARLAIRRSTKTSEVLLKCQALLEARRVSGGTVTLSPKSIENLPTGEEIRVTVSMPWASNSPTRFATGNVSTISVTATMVRE